jgi:hypothetical protein
MPVVGRFDLVLHDERRSMREIHPDQVEREWPDWILPAFELDIESVECVTQHVDVIEEPRREVNRFVRPNLAQVEPLDPSNGRVRHRGSLKGLLRSRIAGKPCSGGSRAPIAALTDLIR